MRVWDAATGQEALTLKGHTLQVNSVCFSADGKRIASKDATGKQIVWDLATGKPLAGVAEPFFSPSPRSPDGRSFALVEGNVIRLHRLPSGKPDGPAAYRWWIDPDYRWHAEQAQQSQQAGDWFAAAFHLGRLLPSRPWDAGLRARRAYALSRLGRTAEAASHALQAVLLDPCMSPGRSTPTPPAGDRPRLRQRTGQRRPPTSRSQRTSPAPRLLPGLTCC